MRHEIELFDSDEQCSAHQEPAVIPSFEAWYARFPRKQGKAEARKRWARMSPAERASAWMALDGWERYVASAGTRYVPYASTWLNQGRWEDDAPEVPQPERRDAPGMASIRRALGR